MKFNICFCLTADNKSKRRRKERKMKNDFTVFAEKSENQKIHISPQLTLATFQFLSTCKYFISLIIIATVFNPIVNLPEEL